jgi:hypothetical protein
LRRDEVVMGYLPTLYICIEGYEMYELPDDIKPNRHITSSGMLHHAGTAFPSHDRFTGFFDSLPTRRTPLITSDQTTNPSEQDKNRMYSTGQYEMVPMSTGGYRQVRRYIPYHTQVGTIPMAGSSCRLPLAACFYF